MHPHPGAGTAAGIAAVLLAQLDPIHTLSLMASTAGMLLVKGLLTRTDSPFPMLAS